MIVKLITEYPQFKVYYKEIYQLCRSTEKVMEMFSKELQELDRNTVQYMIDEMQDVIDAQKENLDRQKNVIDAQKEDLNRQKDVIHAQKEDLSKKNNIIDGQKTLIDTQKRQIEDLKKQLAEKG